MNRPEKKESLFKLFIVPLIGGIVMCLLMYTIYLHMKKKKDRHNERQQEQELPVNK